MDDRRVHDAQIQELHTDVRDLRDAVQTIDRHLNNGITDRGIATEKMVKQLHDEHAGLKNLIQLHIQEETAIHNEMNATVNEQAEVVQSLLKCIGSVKKWGITALVTVVGFLAAAIVWLVIYSPEIGAIVEHLSNIHG